MATKQSHVRLKGYTTAVSQPQDTVSETTEVLIRASVSAGTSKTYASALNTIQKWLASHRKCVDPVVETITPEEFSAFLKHAFDNGSASGNTYRSALVHLQLAKAVPAFAKEATFRKQAKGSASQATPSRKGVLSAEMLHELQDLLLSSVEEFFVTPCRHCQTFFKTELTAGDQIKPQLFNERLWQWTLFQWAARLRPGEVELLRVRDKLTTTESVLKPGELPTCFSAGKLSEVERVTVNSLFFHSRKNDQAGGMFRISPFAAEVFVVLAQGRDEGHYLAPRCVDTHIGQTLLRASELLLWHPDVVWSAHSIRHSAMTALKDGIVESVSEFAAQVAYSTFVHYTSHGLTVKRQRDE